jgi:hypothetical protein
VAEFMTAFPGFADAGSFEMKADELVDGLISQLTGGAMTMSGELEEAITGEIGLAMMDVMEAAMGGSDEPPVIIGVALDDREAAESFMDMLLAAANVEGETTEQMYGDTAIVSDPSTAMAMHDEWLLMSPDVESVKAGIDALEGTEDSLADDADFNAAWARLPDGRLGAAYMDLASFADFIDMAAMMAEGQAGAALPLDDLAAQLPKDMVAYLAAENDRLTVEAFITPGEGSMTFPVGDSDLTGFFPAETQFYVETRELGAAIQTALTGLAEIAASMPVEEDALGTGGMAEIEVLFGEESPITSMLGVPLPDFLDFVSDAAVGSAYDSDGLWLGMAAEVTDDEVASKRIERLMSIIRLMQAGSAMASPSPSSDPSAPAEAGVAIDSKATIAGVPATVITAPIDDAFAGSIVPTLGNTISIVVTDGTLLMGTGDFVENALTQASVDSLGASAGYNDALAGDTPNSGVLYVDLGSILAGLDPMLTEMTPEWTAIAPYAADLDRMIAVGTADDEVITSRMTFIVNK